MITRFTEEMECFNKVINTVVKGSPCYRILVLAKHKHVTNFKNE